MNIRPLQDRVIVRREEPEEAATGGIIIPDTAKEKPQQGTVVSVGKGRHSKDGEMIPPEVKPGDRVVFNKYSGTEYKHDGEVWVILRESDILAVLDK
jgi:chaperonin GroES